MAKKLAVILVVAFFLLNTTQAHALGVGGIVESLDHNVFEVRQKESLGYVCQILGNLVAVKPVNYFGETTTFLIPVGITSRSPNSLRVGQWILALYQSAVPGAVCTRAKPLDVQVLNFFSITIFGVSR